MSSSSRKISLPGIVAILLCLLAPALAQAQVAPALGAARPYAVLGGSTVTNTGSSVVAADLGVSPGSAVTGFPPGIVLSGSIHAADANAAAAQAANTAAFLNLSGQATTVDLTGLDLGGLTLVSGVYNFATSAQLTGTLTLNAAGNPNAVFIFKIGSTLTTASNSRVQIINGGSSCNVFWRVGSSATLGTTTSFLGNVLALTSITLNTGASIGGRALAQNGAVTLDTNAVNATACTGAVACPVITLSPAVLPGGTIGVPYNQTITASGGTAPYTFSVSAGALPAGLSLSPAGVVSGTPTAAGTTVLTIQAVDASACPGLLVQSVVIAVAVPTLPQIFMIALALGLVAAGVLSIRKRQIATRLDPTS